MSKGFLKAKRVISNDMIFELPDHLFAQVVFFDGKVHHGQGLYFFRALRYVGFYYSAL